MSLLQSVDAAYQQAAPWSDVPLFDVSGSVSAGQESKEESPVRRGVRKLLAVKGSGSPVLGGLWSEPGVVAGQARLASARVQVQDEPALVEALSDAELGKSRRLAEWERAQQRRARRRAARRQLRADAVVDKTHTKMSALTTRDELDYQKALSARRRLTSPDARIARTYRYAHYSSVALMGLMLVGMIWGADNIQHNFAAFGIGTTGGLRLWLSYGIEAMLSVPLIVIALHAMITTTWGRQANKKQIGVLEGGFLLVNLVLNAGPHVLAGHYLQAGFHAAPPALVGAAVWLHTWIAARYAELIRHAHIPDDEPAGAGRLGVDQAKLLDAIARVQAGMATGLVKPSEGAVAPSASKIADVYGMSKPDAMLVRDAIKRLALAAA